MDEYTLLGYEGYWDPRKHLTWGAAAYSHNGMLVNGISRLTSPLDFFEGGCDKRVIQKVLKQPIHAPLYSVVQMSHLIKWELLASLPPDGHVDNTCYRLETENSGALIGCGSQSAFNSWRAVAISRMLERVDLAVFDPIPTELKLSEAKARIESALTLSVHDPHARAYAHVFFKLSRRHSVAMLRGDLKAAEAEFDRTVDQLEKRLVRKRLSLLDL
jgi:hypothetical protein